MAVEARLIFKHCAEALLRSLEGKLTPTLQARLSKEGLTPGGELLPGYEYERWARILAATADELMPGDPARAHHTLGEWLTDAYLENFIGRALKPIIKVIGMRRALGRMRQNFRVANNYSEVEVTELSPTHVRLHVNEHGLMAHFYKGVLDRGLRICDPKTLAVTITSEDATGVTYDVQWS